MRKIVTDFVTSEVRFGQFEKFKQSVCEEIDSRIRGISATKRLHRSQNRVRGNSRNVPFFSFKMYLPDGIQFRAAENDNIRSVIDQWIAFCNFHLGDYTKSLEQYKSIRNNDENYNTTVGINVAVCMFYLGMYQESQELIETIPNSPLKVRLLFHLSHKLKDEDRLLELHGSLRDVSEDQLSLAGLHFLRGHYQEAIDIYKRVQLDKK